jgi:hypothetical protein
MAAFTAENPHNRAAFQRHCDQIRSDRGIGETEGATGAWGILFDARDM